MYETIGIIVVVLGIVIAGLHAIGIIKIDISIGKGE